MVIKLVIGIVLLIVIYLIAIMPKITNRPDMSSLMIYHYAHRGLHNKEAGVPENSLMAFALAVESQYGIELDVQLTKDNIPIVFHDYSLKRVCGIDKEVCDLTFEELRTLTLYTTKENIPHLKEVLDLVNGRVPIIVELKMGTSDISLCSIVAPYLDDYNGLYCVESFNPLGLIWYKKYRPRYIRGQLSTDFIKDGEVGDKRLYFLLKNLLLNFLVKPNFIAYNYKHPKILSLVICYEFFKIPTFAWTIDTKQAFLDSRENFDVIIFENFTL